MTVEFELQNVLSINSFIKPLSPVLMPIRMRFNLMAGRAGDSLHSNKRRGEVDHVQMGPPACLITPLKAPQFASLVRTLFNVLSTATCSAWLTAVLKGNLLSACSTWKKLRLHFVLKNKCCFKVQSYLSWTHLVRRWDKSQRLSQKMSRQSWTSHASLHCGGHVAGAAFFFSLLWVIALLRLTTELKEEKMDLSHFKLTHALCVLTFWSRAKLL